MPSTMTRTFRWQEPADRKAGRPRAGARTGPLGDQFGDAAAQLRAHPDRWAAIAEYEAQGSAATLATTIRFGRTLSWLPEGAFDAVSRKEGDVTAVYARYIGDPEQQS